MEGFLLAGAIASAPSCFAPVSEPLRIGVNAWPPFELLYLARERGFFEAEGVKVDLVDFSSYTGVLRSYHQGNIDAFLATLNEVMITDNFEDVPAVVLVADYSYGADAVVVRDAVHGAADLKGKRIAFEESGLGSYFLERFLEIGGLRASEVTALNRLPEEGSEAFRRGAVDAVITYEPDLGRLLREKGARVLFSSRDIPGEIVDVLAFRRSVLEDRKDDVRRLLRAWFRAVADYQARPQEGAAFMARRQNVSVEEFQQGLQGAHIPDREENRQLLGTSDKPGPLHETVDRLGRFLVRHNMARSTARGTDLFHAEIIESL